MANTLTVGQSLSVGQTLWSSNGLFGLVLQQDGNLVVYHQGTAIWATGTNAEKPVSLKMLADGNAALYRVGQCYDMLAE